MDKPTNKPLDLSSLAEAYDRNVLPTLKARMEEGDKLTPRERRLIALAEQRTQAQSPTSMDKP